MTKLSKEIVLERFNRTEDRRKPYLIMAEQWSEMWKLNPGYKKTLEQSVKEGKEQVVLPTPFNVVNLSQRLLSTMPRINVIPNDVSNLESVEYSEQCEKWLTALWKRINKDRGRNVLADAIWYALVRGRFAFEVKWVKESLPKLRRKTMLPISIRALDPMNVGSWAGPLYTEWVYHTYKASLLEITGRWPELKKAKGDTTLGQYIADIDKKTGQGEDVEVTVVDFWYISEKDGSVWNCVLVEDEFAKEPMETDYQDLPIVVGRGDYGVNIGDEWDGLSILHPLNGLWQAQCRLSSMMMTGAMWDYWPAITVENESGAAVDDIDIGPGLTTPVPFGTRIMIHHLEPNDRLAQGMQAQLEGAVQQSSYPDVMYGQAPGSLQAGYGVSLLSDAARGRIKSFAEALEMSISHVCSLVLSLVETMGGEDGVDINMVDERNNEKMTLTLKPEMIKGNYETEVRITPNIPSDDQARITMGLRLSESKKISDQTLRDKYLDVTVPTDEQKRITLEEVMQSDELAMFRKRKALETYYGIPEALSIMYGTDLMPDPPEGMIWKRDYVDGPVRMEPKPQAPLVPPGGPGPAEPGPMGPPPGGQPMGGQGPGPMGPGSPLQPPGIQGPEGGNLMAPAMQGQLTPDMLNMPLQGNQGAFQAAMGRPLSPADELAMLEGQM